MGGCGSFVSDSYLIRYFYVERVLHPNANNQRTVAQLIDPLNLRIVDNHIAPFRIALHVCTGLAGHRQHFRPCSLPLVGRQTATNATKSAISTG